MKHVHVLASAFGMRLAGLANRLFGCPHRRTTFPRTLRSGISANGQQRTSSETYIACLDCGRQFAYDWTTMRITGPRAACSTPRTPAPGETTEPAVAMPDPSHAPQLGTSPPATHDALSTRFRGVGQDAG